MNLCSELSENIAQMEAHLKKCRHHPKNRLKYFSRYFHLTKHESDSGFDYETDREKIECQRKNKGFFLLFTNDMEASASSLLYYYRAKDANEKLFSQIKVDMDGRRIRTHNEQMTDGEVQITTRIRKLANSNLLNNYKLAEPRFLVLPLSVDYTEKFVPVNTTSQKIPL